MKPEGTVIDESATEFSVSGKSILTAKGPVTWLFKHCLRLWYYFPTALIGTLCNTFMAAIAPILLERVVNQVSADPPDTSHIWWLTLCIGGSQLLRIPLQYLRSASFEFVAQKLECNIREDAYISLLGKSMTYHSLRPVGDTMTRATDDVHQINLMLNPGLHIILGSSTFLILPLIVSFKYHPSLCIAPIIFIIGYIIATWHHFSILTPVSENVRRLFGQINVRLAETLDGIETVKGGAMEHYEQDIFLESMDAHRKHTVKQGDIESRFLPMLLLAIVSGGALLHAIVLYNRGEINTGEVIGYFSMILMLEFPAFASIFAFSYVATGMAAAKRILEVITTDDSLNRNTNGHRGTIRGDVEFHGVSFSYPDGKHVFQEASFTIKPGQTAAIVGQTGSGKTTMARLLNRTFDATAGQVLIDGVDVREWKMSNLRRQISFIEQDIFLFSKSVYDNIAFGRPDATRDEVIESAQKAQAHEFIESFADGYETIIGERGVTLSGGQRQRLALARAFLTKPGLLILDDSTSAIDSATEDKIQQAIFNVSKDQTTVIITHRLSQIRWADIIIVLKDGHIAAIGNHEDLMDGSQEYRNIFARF